MLWSLFFVFPGPDQSYRRKQATILTIEWKYVDIHIFIRKVISTINEMAYLIIGMNVLKMVTNLSN